VADPWFLFLPFLVALAKAPASTKSVEDHLRNLPSTHDLLEKTTFQDNPSSTNFVIATNYPVVSARSHAYDMTMGWSSSFDPERVDTFPYATIAGTLNDDKVSILFLSSFILY
jgi:hypothetical protein